MKNQLILWKKNQIPALLQSKIPRDISKSAYQEILDYLQKCPMCPNRPQLLNDKYDNRTRTDKGALHGKVHPEIIDVYLDLI
jgi:hypothetical protein